MSFSNANRVSVNRVREVTFGVTPASPALKRVRITGEGLEDSISTAKSAELRSDRMVDTLAVVDSSPGGGLNIEFSLSTYDEILEALMMSAWSAQLNIASVGGDLVLATAGPHLSSVTADKFLNVQPGQWIRLTGFAAGSGYYQVTAKSVNNLELTLFPVPAVNNTPAGTTGKVDGSFIRNGVTEYSDTLVKIYEDLAVATRHIFRGMRASSMNLEMATGSLMTGSLNYMGKTGEMSTSTFAGETFVDSTSTEVLNCVSDIQNIIQDGGALGTPGSIMSLSMEINNNHREQKGLGILGNAGVAAGRLTVNYNMTVYFESKDQYDKFKAGTSFSFSFRLQDLAGNSLIVTAPRSKYETLAVPATGIDTDVMADGTFTALRDPVTNCMLQLDRFIPAA